MKKYVLGFAFSRNKGTVVLIEKRRPEWQRGFFNGVGGKIENYETAFDAMVREFKEETSVDTLTTDWSHFATMIFENDIMGGRAEIYCYKLSSNLIYQCKTVEDERIELVTINELENYPLRKETRSLIYDALDDNLLFTEKHFK